MEGQRKAPVIFFNTCQTWNKPLFKINYWSWLTQKSLSADSALNGKGGVPCSRLLLFSHRPKRAITKLSCFPWTFADIPANKPRLVLEPRSHLSSSCFIFGVVVMHSDGIKSESDVTHLDVSSSVFDIFKLRPDHVWMLLWKMMQLCKYLNHRVLWNQSSSSSPSKRVCFQSVTELPADPSHVAALWAHESLGCPGTSFQETAHTEYTRNGCLMQKVAKLSFNHCAPQTVVTSHVLWFHSQNACQSWMFVKLTWLTAVETNQDQMETYHHITSQCWHTLIGTNCCSSSNDH